MFSACAILLKSRNTQLLLCTKDSCVVAKIVNNYSLRNFSCLRNNLQSLFDRNTNSISGFFSPKFPKRTFQTTKRSSNVGRPLNPILTEKLSNPLDVNTNVQNNVLVYKFNRELLCKGAFFLGMVCMLGLLSMADNVYRVYIKQQNKALPLKDRLIKFAIPATAVFIGLTCGPVITAGMYFIASRLVKFLVLHKGGEKITIITHHPIWKAKVIEVPVENVKCVANRFSNKSYSAFKLKGRKGWFFVDKSGHFVNPDLFDSTVGIARDYDQ